MKTKYLLSLTLVLIFLAFESQASDIIGKSLKIRVYLQGALMKSGVFYSASGKKLMRDNLRVNPFDGKNYIPTSDPYQTTVGLVDLSKSNKHIGAGSTPSFCKIDNPTKVFGVTGENAIVDWIFIEIRSAQFSNQVITTRSGLLQRDGDVVDVDGVSDLSFPDLTASQFYVVVKHRNHISAMSSLVDGSSVVDFTKPETPLFTFSSGLSEMNYQGLGQHKSTEYKVMALWAGDANSDCAVKKTMESDDLNVIFIENQRFFKTNVASGAIGYYQGDIDMNGRVKYDGSGDDSSIFMSILKEFSLNKLKLENFSHFIEQLPARIN